MIKWDMNRSEFVNEYLKLRPHDFTREALEVIFDYYEGDEIDFDPAAIRAEWSEFDDEAQVVAAYGYNSDEILDYAIKLRNGNILIKEA